MARNDHATAMPFARPLYVMLKPASSHCNLACEYCYYIEKKHLYEDGKRHLISDETLELFTKEYIEAQNQAQRNSLIIHKSDFASNSN